MSIQDQPPYHRGDRVVDVILRRIAAEGVLHIFGVGGANIEDIYDAINFNCDLTGVVAKHEFSAAAMADGYARVSAGLGVVVATSGGGCLNLIPGLGEAFASRVPVLALIGQPSSELSGSGVFQDGSGHSGSLNIEAVFRPVSVFCQSIINPAEVLEVLQEAIAAARRGGPAVLLLPKDIQQATFPELASAPKLSPGKAPPPFDQITLTHYSHLLADAAPKIVIIAGDEIARHDARAQLAELTVTLGAYIAVTPDAKDVVAPDAPYLLGVAGMMGQAGVARALADAELCLLIGTRLPMIASGGLVQQLQNMPVISIGSETPFVPATHVATSDLATSLSQLIAALPPQPQRVYPAEVALGYNPTSTSQQHSLGYADAIAVLDRTLPTGADIFVDAGNSGAANIHYLPPRKDGRFIVALGMGGMGYSFGAGIGSAFKRSRRTIVIAGDGAFYMHGMEIHTAIEHHLPISFIVFDNSAHAMCATREKIYYSAQYSFNRFHYSAQLGNGMGTMFPQLPAFTASSVRELEHALTASIASNGPSFVTIRCDSSELPPFAPFLNPAI